MKTTRTPTKIEYLLDSIMYFTYKTKMVYLYVVIYEKWCLFVNIKRKNHKSAFQILTSVSRGLSLYWRGIKLQSKHDTLQIWFIDPCIVRGISLQICRKCLIHWIAFSTWICNLAIIWLSVTSFWESWFLPAKEDGMLKVTPKDFNCFFIVNSLSAIMWSSLPQSSLLRMPHLLTIPTTDVEPS